MTTQSTHSPAVRTLFVAAAIVTFGAVALGSVVCATDSSAACPNWPGCYRGQVTPEAELNPVLEFVHRVVAVSTGPLLLAAAVVGLRSRDLLVRVLPWIALAGAMVAGVLGMLTVKRGISTGLAAFDLTSSLVAMLAITLAAVCVLRAPRQWRRNGWSAITWSAVALWVATHVTSIFVAGPGSLTRCVSWPVWELIEIDGDAGPQWVRLGLASIAVVVSAFVVVVAMKRPETRVIGAVVAVLMVVELAMGFTVLRSGADLPTKAVYAATPAAILCGLGWIASLATIRRALAA